jgi:hypothetical protein
LITFLIPFDLALVDCEFTPSSLWERVGVRAYCRLTLIVFPSLPIAICESKGSRDNNATPLTTIEDEIKKRLFIIRLEDKYRLLLSRRTNFCVCDRATITVSARMTRGSADPAARWGWMPSCVASKTFSCGKVTALAVQLRLSQWIFCAKLVLRMCGPIVALKDWRFAKKRRP